MKIKPVSDLVPKARKAAEDLRERPTDVSRARQLVIMVDKLTEHGIAVDFFTYSRYCDAHLVLNGVKA